MYAIGAASPICILVHNNLVYRPAQSLKHEEIIPYIKLKQFTAPLLSLGTVDSNFLPIYFLHEPLFQSTTL
jgi:hypothetical protein